MNWRGIQAVIRKDLQVVIRSKAVVLPLILLPLIMLVLMPAIFGLAARYAPVESLDIEEFDQILSVMPPQLLDQLSGLDDNQLFLIISLVYIFAPLYLIMPFMVASVIAADSFAGEKERKTLEALLHSPLTDRELYLAKLLSAWIPAIAISLVSFVLYGVTANMIGYPLMGYIFFPNWMWIVLVLWVAPAASGMSLAATVLISTRVKTYQEATQLGSVIVLPIVGMLLAQVGGLLYFNVGVVFLLGLALWIITALILFVGIRQFERDAIFARL